MGMSGPWHIAKPNALRASHTTKFNRDWVWHYFPRAWFTVKLNYDGFSYHQIQRSQGLANC